MFRSFIALCIITSTDCVKLSSQILTVAADMPYTGFDHHQLSLADADIRFFNGPSHDVLP